MGAARLCIVNPFQHGGGAEYQIACLLDVLLPASGMEVFYLAHHVEPAADKPGCQVVKIGASSGTPRFGYLEDAPALHRALTRLAPDVIYQRVAGGYTGVCAYYARRHGVRSIWHVAHDTDVMPQGFIADRNPVRRWLEKRSVEYGARHMRQVVTQTHHQAALLQANYGRPATAVIPNFQPEPAQQIDKSGPLTVAWIANFKRWKRPEVFVRLAAQLRDVAGVRFVMVGSAASGSGDAEWGQALLREIEAAPNLSYLGRRSQAEVDALLATAHVLVNTSVAEGFANTFIQAWMREVPVVSFGVDPDGILMREQVGVCATTEQELVIAVRRFVTDATLRSEFAARARHYALASHSLRNAAALAHLIVTGSTQ